MEEWYLTLKPVESAAAFEWRYIKIYIVGCGGALVESTPLDRRVVGSNPYLATM